ATPSPTETSRARYAAVSRNTWPNSSTGPTSTTVLSRSPPVPEPDKTTTVVAVTVTVHCVTSAQVIKASEILSTAVGALALDGINARMKVQPHEPNRH